MYTIIETPAFKNKADAIWSESERLEFISYLSLNPLMGDVIPNTEGLRKIRWSISGRGKRGGVRVIYFNMLEDGNIILIDIYEKSIRSNLSAKQLSKLRGMHK